MPVKPYQQEFWKLLSVDEGVGIDVTLLHPRKIEEIHNALNALEDYPLEWFAPLKETVLQNGVKNATTVLEYMTVSKARNVPPGWKPQPKEDKPQYDDQFIKDYYIKLMNITPEGEHRERYRKVAS